MADLKQVVAEVIARRVQDGETIGIGSGSTVWLAIEKIAQRVAKENLKISCLAASHASAFAAERAGLNVLPLISERKLDWAFDGADEVDPQLNLIKGAWGAMLKEKILAQRSEKFVVIVSEDKLVKRLGKKFAVPVEVVPEAAFIVQEELAKLGAVDVRLRKDEKKGSPFNTEHNNFVLDAKFKNIEPSLEAQINALPGVLDNGIFINRASEVLIAKASGVYSLRRCAGQIKEELILSPDKF
ncbi:MAG: ribose 5-phosphate isomerase A [Deltaproteobacteria bacterium]|nr:ribose 5-phosphate isomerase A [Deltaproteobacteria bacterium]